MTQSYRSFLRRIIQLENAPMMPGRLIKISRVQLKQLTDQKQVEKYGYTMRAHGEKTRSPLPGFYRICWKETAHTYRLIDYIPEKDVFIFQIFKDSAIISTVISIRSDLKNDQSTDYTHWYQHVQKILSDSGDFLVAAPYDEDWDNPLASFLNLCK